MSGLARFKAKPLFHAKRYKLASGKTYIFPTGFGFAFGILSFILLVMAIGYGNNVLYFFVFLLVSMGLSTSWLTNNNIESVLVTDLTYDSLFANERNSVLLKIENKKPKKAALFDVEMQIEHANKKMNQFNIINEVDVQGFLNLTWQPLQRGLVDSPRVMMQSRFPYKILRSWKYYEKNTRCLVYPERKGDSNIRTLIGHQSQRDEAAKLESEGLFRDYREFQNSDSPNRIDWKRSVKHGKHLVKNYEQSGERKILIDWQMTDAAQSLENRISQMALWVDLCHQQNENYSLRIEKQQIDFGTGLVHYKNCLEKLALLSPADVQT